METRPPGRSEPIPYNVSSSTIRMIRSNQAPLESQAKEIQESIIAAEKVKSSLALQITAAQLELLRLQRLDGNASRHIERCTAALGPIRRLPPEVLSHIFSFYHREFFREIKIRDLRRGGRELRREMPWDDSQEIWKLGQISSYWRSVALGIRELWSTVRFVCCRRTAHAQATNTWLLRGGNHPLSFTFICPGHDDDSSAIANACRGVFDTLLVQSDRWKDAQFKIPESFLPAFATLRDHVANLETLKYTIVSASQSQAQVHLFNAFSVAPKLRDLSLSDVLSRVTAVLPWGQITRYLGDESDRTDTHILTLAPNILAFVLNTRHPAPGLSGTTLVHQLRELSFISGYQTLACLILPSLESLRFSMSSPGGFPAPISPITDLLTRSGKTVTELHIDGFDPAHLDILGVFAATPALTSLALANRLVYADLHARTATHAEVGHIFDRIAHQRARTVPALLPKLRYLSATGVTVGEAFFRMVESRSAASRETVRLKSLALSNGTVVDLDHASMCGRLDHLSAHGMEVTVDSMIHQASRAEMQDLQLDL